MSGAGPSVLTRIRQILSQDIDPAAVRAAARAGAARLLRRVVLMPGLTSEATPPIALRLGEAGEDGCGVSLPHGESDALTILAVPSSWVHSFELNLPHVKGISDASLIESNFEAHAPFERESVFWVFRRSKAVLEVRYVARKTIAPVLAAWEAAGQAVDGLSLGRGGEWTVFPDRRATALRLVKGNRTILLRASAIVLTLCIMSQWLAQRGMTRDAIGTELSHLLAERRAMERPGNAAFEAAVSGSTTLSEARLALNCLERALPAEAAVAVLRANSGAVQLRFSGGEAATTQERLGEACRRGVERNPEGVWWLRPRASRP